MPLWLVGLLFVLIAALLALAMWVWPYGDEPSEGEEEGPTPIVDFFPPGG